MAFDGSRVTLQQTNFCIELTMAISSYFYCESVLERDKKHVLQFVYDQVVDGRRPGVCLHFADTIDNAHTRGDMYLREYVCELVYKHA